MDDLITNKQFCHRFGISLDNAWRQRRAGLLPYRLVAMRICYTEDDIAVWIENCKLAAEQQHAMRYPEKKRGTGKYTVKRKTGRPPNIENLERKRTVLLKRARQAVSDLSPAA